MIEVSVYGRCPPILKLAGDCGVGFQERACEVNHGATQHAANFGEECQR